MKIVIAFIAGMACMFLITYITAKLVLWDDSVDFYGDEEEEYHEERRGIFSTNGR